MLQTNIFFGSTQSFCFAVKIILQGKHKVSDTFKCYCLTDEAALHFCLMLREISILYIYSVWTRGSESRFSLRFCEWPVQCQIRRQRAYPTTGVCGHSTRKIAKNWNSLGTFSSILAGKFYASIRLEKRCDVYFVEKLKQTQTAHTKRISCVLKLFILNDRLSLISWLLSSELAAIFGEAYYGSPWVGTSVSTIVIYICQFWNHSNMPGLPWSKTW